MTAEGQIVLFRFPQTDQQSGKLRPALIIRRLPGLIRICRLAVVSGDILIGKIGDLDSQRLSRIKQKLSQWIQVE
ncbi:MAG: hypothetical protein C0392_06300 [Syntrophus sp. (in: bacteria)]|nr:hypothetical protein [Syntrophus sp. (in: bacteria)]